MSYEAIVQQYFTNVSSFWTKTIQRYSTAKTLAQGPPPGYTADNFSNDVAGFWADAFDAWMAVPPWFGSPLLPTVFIASPGNVLTAVTQAAFVGAAIPDGAVSVTDLVGTGTIASGGGTLTANIASGQLNVTLTLPAAQPAGSYQSLAYRSANPIGAIFVVLT